MSLEQPFSPYSSDGDAFGSLPGSPTSDTHLASLELEMDQVLSSLLQDKLGLSGHTARHKVPFFTPALRKKRGRRPLRPNDPIRKKTEEKDKYWLRAFRAYMKLHFTIKKETMNEFELLFWLNHLGPTGKPEKGKKYRSYGTKYKDFLFSHSTFVNYFQEWFTECGHEELSKRCNPESGLWVVFYNYAAEELINYIPRSAASLNSSVAGSPRSVDICLVMDEENGAFIDSF